MTKLSNRYAILPMLFWLMIGAFAPRFVQAAPLLQCTPTVTFTNQPAYGSFENLQGQVACVTPANYKIAVYIFESGWWTKPTFAAPLTTIQNNSTWTTDITTGPGDEFATQIMAFLVPNGYTPPQMAGEQSLPATLYNTAVASQSLTRGNSQGTITFAGRTWNVKSSNSLVGPGPNYFSNRPEDVWVDAFGQLHLTIHWRDGRWHSTEIYSTESFGYGDYIFKVASDVGQLDPNVVLGLFTWDNDAPEHHYREIDIEFAKWSNAADPTNSQYVVQPYTTPGNLQRFTTSLQGDYSTHLFKWRADQVEFASYHGHTLPAPAGYEIANWVYTGADIPPAGGEHVHINLWLVDGAPPVNGQAVEVILTAFSYLPPSTNSLIFADGFESGNFTAWSSSARDGGDLTIQNGAAVAGIYGLRALLDDNRNIFVTDDRPDAEPSYQVRFHFDPNSIPMATGDSHVLFYGYKDTSTPAIRLELRFVSGLYQLRPALRTDSSTWKTSSVWHTISDAPHLLALNWQAATAAGANNGALAFAIDGIQKANFTGVDNDTMRIDRARMGAVAGIDNGTRGQYYFDAFESHRSTAGNALSSATSDTTSIVEAAILVDEIILEEEENETEEVERILFFPFVTQ